MITTLQLITVTVKAYL